MNRNQISGVSSIPSPALELDEIGQAAVRIRQRSTVLAHVFQLLQGGDDGRGSCEDFLYGLKLIAEDTINDANRVIECGRKALRGAR